MNLLDKLLDLKNRFLNGDREDVVQIEAWIEEARRLILLDNLFKHDGIKYVYNIFASEIKKINSSLLKSDSKEMSDYQRDRLIDKRDLMLKYINLFTDLTVQIEQIEEIVDKQTDNSV